MDYSQYLTLQAFKEWLQKFTSACSCVGRGIGGSDVITRGQALFIVNEMEKEYE